MLYSKNNSAIGIRTVPIHFLKCILPALLEKRYLLPFLLFWFSSNPATAAEDRNFDLPLMLGPQYPIMYMSTTFVPDSAFTLPQGDFFFQFRYLETNSYAFSSNFHQNENMEEMTNQFNSEKQQGYAAFVDGELHRKIVRFHLGLLEEMEVQLVYRDIKFSGGHLDATIENFHSNFNLGNQKRENTDRDVLNFYVVDKETGESVFQLTDSSPHYHTESLTLGVKYMFYRGESDAASFRILSNFGDQYMERDINEVPDEKKRSHHNFNDGVVGIHYSKHFDRWTLHAALAVAEVKNSLFEKSPDYIAYAFCGGSWHASDNWDILAQTLYYTSPYPEYSSSQLGRNIVELTAGFHWFFTSYASLDFGFVENHTQGAQNIDITFFSALNLQFS